jgi:asparagine synthase (glutamine-hydrolysing)
MQGYLLRAQGDRVLMGHAVEGRFPYLDHQLIELAARVPDRLLLWAPTRPRRSPAV